MFRWFDSQLCARGSPFLLEATSNSNNTKKMANSKEKIAEFVSNKLFRQLDSDAIPRMSRMLYIDKTITDINVRDSSRTIYIKILNLLQ